MQLLLHNIVGHWTLQSFSKTTNAPLSKFIKRKQMSLEYPLVLTELIQNNILAKNNDFLQLDSVLQQNIVTRWKWKMSLHYIHTLCQKYILKYNDEMGECTDTSIFNYYKYLQQILLHSL